MFSGHQAVGAERRKRRVQILPFAVLPAEGGTGEHQRAQLSGLKGGLHMLNRKRCVASLNGRTRPVDADADIGLVDRLQNLLQRQETLARGETCHGITMFKHQVAGPVPRGDFANRAGKCIGGLLNRSIADLRSRLHLQRDNFSRKTGIHGVNFLVQMTVEIDAGFTLRFVSRCQAKRTVGAPAAHGFHNGGDNHLPVARRMAEQPFITKRMEIFQTRLFQPSDIRRVGKCPPEGPFFLFPLLVKRGCAGVRTNNKTGVGHFAFLYLSEN